MLESSQFLKVNLVTAPKTTAIQLLELTSEFSRLQPAAVVTIADRYETIATAIAASYMNIPLIHVQGGEVTGSIDEKVRHAVTKLADLHLVSTQNAGDRVIRMGEYADRVFVTGCPSIDLAAEAVAESPRLEQELFAKYKGVGDNVSIHDDYIVLMQHPVTTDYEHSGIHITKTLAAAKRTGLKVFCFWPNPDSGSDAVSSGIRRFRELEHPHDFAFFKNIEPEDFIRLLKGAKCLVGNSSVGVRECSYLGVPVVNIGDRQQSRERAHNVIDVDYDETEIYQAIMRQVAAGGYAPDPLYGRGDAGKKIASVIADWDLSLKKVIAY